MRTIKNLGLVQEAPKHKKRFDKFDIKSKKISSTINCFMKRTLLKFILGLFSHFGCENSCFIVALCLIEKLLIASYSSDEVIMFNHRNSFKIIAVALMIATKNYDDFFYSNIYYSRVCGLQTS